MFLKTEFKNSIHDWDFYRNYFSAWINHWFTATGHISYVEKEKLYFQFCDVFKGFQKSELVTIGLDDNNNTAVLDEFSLSDFTGEQNNDSMAVSTL